MLVQDLITEAFEETEIPPTFRKFASLVHNSASKQFSGRTARAAAKYLIGQISSQEKFKRCCKQGKKNFHFPFPRSADRLE